VRLQYHHIVRAGEIIIASRMGSSANHKSVIISLLRLRVFDNLHDNQ
jgi:hypothetical protein